MKKDILIYGLGRTNTALFNFLQKNSTDRIFVTSDSDDELNSINESPTNDLTATVLIISPEESLKKEFTEIYLTPGIPVRHPVHTKKNLRNEIEFARPFFKKARFVGITGSNGKSTTCKLFHEYLTYKGYRCALAGNYGTPLCAFLSEAGQYDFVILELSSFQLHVIKNRFLDFALISSFEPNHLDWHSSLAEYIKDKIHIFALRKPEAPGIISESVLKYSPNLLKQEKNIGISPLSPQNATSYGKGAKISCPPDKINFLLDFLNTMHLPLPDENFCFNGLEHRMEKGQTPKGVFWINDSKSTTPGSTIFALQNCCKQNNIRLILGGKDKKIPFEPFLEKLKDYQNIIQRIYIYGEVNFYAAKLKEAGFSTAAFQKWPEMLSRLQAETLTGDCLLLSPGFSSLDQFSSYEQRGKLFKEFVQGL
jgi:UDP-N-acetylmuramoylalanine--D-glutamate ligase